MPTASATATLTIALDNAAGTPRRTRRNALLLVHADMIAANLPASSPLWAKLEDAHEELMVNEWH